MTSYAQNRRATLYIWLQQAIGTCTGVSGLLASRFEDVEDIYNCDDFSFLGKNRDKYIAGLGNKSLTDAHEIYKRCVARGIKISGRFDSDYPTKLKRISAPPVALYYIGTLKALDSMPCVGMVGPRDASGDALRTAFDFASELASRGCCVISGLAKGIDAASHKGALASDGYTVGVLGCAIDKVYPKENLSLYETLYEKGLVISEYYPSFSGTKGCFPSRNRIISALSDCVAVFEAGEQSGSLITASHASKHGIPVFAVPCTMDLQSGGMQRLILQGAAAIDDAVSIVRRMSWDDNVKNTKETSSHGIKNNTKRGFKLVLRDVRDGNDTSKDFVKTVASDTEALKNDGTEDACRVVKKTFSGENSKPILALLEEGRPLTSDEICRRTGLTINEVLIELTHMEFDDLVTAMPGDRYVRR